MKQDTSGKVVIHRTKHDKKDISKEPEMKELKRMIRTGELDPEKTIDHLRDKDRTPSKSATRILTGNVK